MSRTARISPVLRRWAVVFLVFGIAGSIAAVLGRVLIGALFGVEGSLWEGPWLYRALYLLLITPSYSVTLIAVGTLFGKRAYFQSRVLRTWGLLLPTRWTAAARRSRKADAPDQQ